MRLSLDLAAALGIVFLAAQAWGAEGDAGRGGAPGASLIDGTEVDGEVISLGTEGALFRGAPAKIALEDIREIRLAPPPSKAASLAAPAPGVTQADRPAVYFATGEVLPGRAATCDGAALGFEPDLAGAEADLTRSGAPAQLRIPLALVRALRVSPEEDAELAGLLAGPRPAKDTVIVRDGDRTLRVEGLLRSIDGNDLKLEYAGKERRVRRSRVLGVALAEVAGAAARASGAVVTLAGGGRLPCRIRGLEMKDGAGTLRFELGGESGELPCAALLRITLGGDRLRFLSSLDPANVEECPPLGGSFPWRRDRAVGGGPLRLGGATAARGIGVHARSRLEWSLDGGFGLFLARVGIDDGAGGRGRAVVRVLGDGKLLLERTVGVEAPSGAIASPAGSIGGNAAMLELRVPIEGVKSLALEADFAPGDLGLASHVDWADARVVRPAGGGR